jgi:16S rRNA (cytosine1402-N4)-methyltransferase
MDPSKGHPVWKLLRHAEKDRIASILKNFGEERFARRIAHAISERMKLQPITRTKELTKIIYSVVPYSEKNKHPATRTFQALRIWVNDELGELQETLDSSIQLLSKGGRLSVISYHSLEDRIVKRFIQKKSQGPVIPRGVPMTQSELRKLGTPSTRSIGKLLISREEVSQNSRSRSAVLRVVEKIK